MQLTRNRNLTLPKLTRSCRSADGDVYSYVMASVTLIRDRFKQRGNAPNWQGGIVTWCTCKHKMRTFMDTRGWPGTWVAGFTGKPEGANWLVYLMRVGWAFESHAELWEWLDPDVREKKAADRQGNLIGDLYRPRVYLSGDERFEPSNYFTPCRNHVHVRDKPKEWHRDIDCLYGSKRPALLVGDPAQSYLWDTPRIRFITEDPRGIGRAVRKHNVSELLTECLSEPDRI